MRNQGVRNCLVLRLRFIDLIEKSVAATGHTYSTRSNRGREHQPALICVSGPGVLRIQHACRCSAEVSHG